MNSGHPHLVCQRRKESELTIQAKIKKGLSENFGTRQILLKLFSIQME